MKQTRPRPIPPAAIAIAIEKNGNRPLYTQIGEKIMGLIAAEELLAGERLPPVRILAGQLGVNQMTVAKAYRDLAEAGFVEGRRGGGTFVRAPGVPAPKRGTRGANGSKPLLSERLFDLARAPGVIAFTGNYPRADARLVEEFRACVAAAIAGDIDSYFRYDPPAGRPELRLRIGEYLAAQGIAAGADDVIITSGAQQAIDIVARCLVPRGAPVVIERPAYYGAINALRAAGARLVEAPVERDGMDVSALEALLKRHRPRLIYTNPTFQNPTGVTTSLEKRKEILALARRYGAAIVEDDHCPELRFSGSPVPPIRALADPQEAVFYVRGFGKALLPGIRLGCIIAPPASRKALLAMKAQTDLHSSAVIQEAFALFLHRQRFAPVLADTRAAHAAHQRLLCDRLARDLPGVGLIGVPEGGLSLWLALPPGADVSELYYRSVLRGVAFVAGEVFYATRPDPGTLRVSFGLIRPEEIEEGVDRLCSVVSDLLAPDNPSPMIVI